MKQIKNFIFKILINDKNTYIHSIRMINITITILFFYISIVFVVIIIGG